MGKKAKLEVTVSLMQSCSLAQSSALKMKSCMDSVQRLEGEKKRTHDEFNIPGETNQNRINQLIYKKAKRQTSK